MTSPNQAGPRCLICEEKSKEYIPIPHWGAMHRCLSCGFVFAQPMSLPSEGLGLFDRAYNGRETRAGMHDFYMRTLIQEDVRKGNVRLDNVLSTPAKAVIGLLRKEVPQGSTILDIGCGMGYFLDAISKLGYKAAGLEISQPVVELLRRRGYPIWHGTIDTLPAGWIQPQVCTSFFTLHHLTDPIGFIRTIRSKFPQAMLILAEYDYSYLMRGKNVGQYAMSRQLPPRCRSWWLPRTLQIAVERAGYEVHIVSIQARTRDIWIPYGSNVYMGLRRYLPFLFPWLTRIYYHIFLRLAWPWSLYQRLRWGNGFILAIGRPR